MSPSRPLRATWCALFLTATLLTACSSSDGGDSKASDATTTTGARSGGSGGVTTDADCTGDVESPDTRFLVDDCGRTLILRGVNVEGSAKGASQDVSHLPSSDLENQASLQTWGWNTVRFLVFWGAIEPEEGTYDETYLDDVEQWVDWYGDHGIDVVFDVHQDLYGWTVNGNGAPDWAVDTQGLEVKPIAEGQPWYLQGADPAVQAAFQSFWNPADGDTRLQDHYLASVAHLTERFADNSTVIGIDVMNEPSFANGDLNATLAIQPDAAAGNFNNENLTAFNNRAIEAVRAVDPDVWVFIQPTSLINAFPYPGDLLEDQIVDPRDGAPRIVYAGHLYEPKVHDGLGYSDDSTYVKEWRTMRTQEAKAMKGALWFGEWGSNGDQEGMDRYVSDVLTMADEEMAGWAWWSWDPGNGWSPVESDGKTPSANGERLLRVQPRAVVGVPTDFTWDAKASTFKMTWDENEEAKGSTDLAVPGRLFPDGIEVVLDGATVDRPTWDEETSVLSVDADRTKATHEVCITAAGSDGCR